VKITPRWIRTKFEKKRGNDPYSKAWDEIPEDCQSSMLQGVLLDNDEVPICAITAPPNPVVITAKRMVWRSNGLTHDLQLTDLESVEAPEALPVMKLDKSELLVTTRSGEKHLLATAPGKTLFVLWNLLLQFTRNAAPSRRG
jgi:hypothetical protein